MNKKKNAIYKNLFFAAALIFIAILCRYIILSVPFLSPFSDKLLNYIRIFIYIGILSLWGVTVSRRVMQPKVRRMLISIASLMVFWLVIREFRYHYIIQPDILRFIWYMYYIPMLIIPLLGLYISVFLGKEKEYKTPAFMWFFSILSGVFIILILTNDLHQFAFVFEDINDHNNYEYGWLYYTATAWVYLCSGISFITMLRKLKAPNINTFFVFVPFAFAIIYGALYASRVQFVLKYLGDVTVVFCLVFAAFFESCIQCGLIQSNSGYFELFTSSVDTPVQITDKNYNVKYRAASSESFAVDDIKRAKEKPVIIDGQKRLHVIEIKGGLAVWSEDISELLSLYDDLKERREELEERNAFLELEYEKEKEHQTVAEQNRLYDLLQKKTQAQLDKIEEYVQQYKEAKSKEEKQSILAHIIVFGTFIKRQKNFILSMENESEFSELMLSSAISESFRALRLLEINGSYLIKSNKNSLPSRTLFLAYDFFEDVIETILDEAKFINFRFCEIGGKLRINILADSKSDFSSLKLKYPGLIIEYDDEGGSEFILEPKGGDAYV